MAIRIENKHISLSVRDLVLYKPKSSGLLSSFPLHQRGMLGKQAQDKIQQIRMTHRGIFHREVSIQHSFSYRGYSFTVFGRIDGVLDTGSHIEVEEIKTVLIDPTEFKKIQIEEFPEFIEQINIYCYLLTLEKIYPNPLPVLILYNLLNTKIKYFRPVYEPGSIEELIHNRCEQIIEAIEQGESKYKMNLKKIRLINFQLPEKRMQQEEMITAVSEALENQVHLLISAPTGTGKTAAALYPAIRYAIENRKRVVYLTAKNTQHKIIQKTIQSVTDQDLELSVSMLHANRKMCANDIFFCHPDFCLYAKNYQNEIKRNALSNALSDIDILSADIVFKISEEAKICPAEMMFDLAKKTDILVADYNYLFDHRSRLNIFQAETLDDWILIIDEAHNLPQRVNDSLSPQISRRMVDDLSGMLFNKRMKVYRTLNIALKKIDLLFGQLQQEGENEYPYQQYFTLQLDLKSWKHAYDEYENAFIAYLLFKARKRLVLLDDPLEIFYYQFRRFIQIAEMEEKPFTAYFNAAGGGTIGIHCADSSEYISRTIDKFHNLIAMSATLDPIHYYQKILGFQKDKASIHQLTSPFSNQNRRIVIVPNISTYYRDRINLYPRYAQMIREIIDIHSGNYIVFGPSFEFIQTLRLFLGKVQHSMLMQRPKMTETEREWVFTQLSDQNDPKLLLAVMGGIFAEGIDFNSTVCSGLIIFSPAIPKITFERELTREYYENNWGNGFNYAYLYPGMNKVIQAAGRLIRSQQDRGIIVLAGERFARDEISQLLPSYWFENPGDVIVTENYKQSISKFWKRFV